MSGCVGLVGRAWTRVDAFTTQDADGWVARCQCCGDGVIGWAFRVFGWHGMAVVNEVVIESGLCSMEEPGVEYCGWGLAWCEAGLDRLGSVRGKCALLRGLGASHSWNVLLY